MLRKTLRLALDVFLSYLLSTAVVTEGTALTLPLFHLCPEQPQEVWEVEAWQQANPGNKCPWPPRNGGRGKPGDGSRTSGGFTLRKPGL